MTVFERCVEACEDQFDYTAVDSAPSPRSITTAVLAALAEHTESPRTVDEVMRVLGEAG